RDAESPSRRAAPRTSRRLSRVAGWQRRVSARRPCLLSRREREPERGARSWCAGDADVPAVGLYQLLGDEQPQPRAAGWAAGQAEVLLEDGLLVLERDAGSRVPHLEAHLAAGDRGAHRHGAPLRAV